MVENADRIEFCLGEVFPAEDELAQCVMTLSIGLGDLRTVIRYTVREDQSDAERLFFVRLFASHMRELVKAIALGVERKESLRDFVENTLSEEGRAAFDQLQPMLAAPFETRPEVTLLDELKRIRDVTWHYPLDPEFLLLLRDAMRRAASSGSRGAYAKTAAGEIRAEYADDVGMLLTHPLDGTEAEKRAQAEELHGALTALSNVLATFLQHAEASYFEAKGVL
jgi:hypothetical protein